MVSLRSSSWVVVGWDGLLIASLGFNSSNYWSAEVMLFTNSRLYLWVTTRAQVNTTIPGYIFAFLLDEEGIIVKQMFRCRRLPSAAKQT